MLMSDQLFGYIHAITITQAYHHGLGRHLYYLTEAQLSEAFRFGFFSLAWGFLSPMAGRISFCIFMFWVAGTDPRMKRWPVYCFMVLQVIVNVVAVLVAYLQCGTHLSILWTPELLNEMPHYCLDPGVQTYYGYFQGSFNTLTDLFLTVLPALVVWHTKMSMRAKLALASLLCLSVL